MKILVTFAGKYGPTRRRAECIGSILSRSGFGVIVCAADEVTSVRGFDAVIVGNTTCSAGWLLEVEEFLESFQAELSKIPVWLFSDRPTEGIDPQKTILLTAEGEPTELKNDASASEKIKRRDDQDEGWTAEVARRLLEQAGRKTTKAASPAAL